MTSQLKVNLMQPVPLYSPGPEHRSPDETAEPNHDLADHLLAAFSGSLLYSLRFLERSMAGPQTPPRLGGTIKNGLVIVHTGNGKGKTTAALGLTPSPRTAPATAPLRL